MIGKKDYPAANRIAAELSDGNKENATLQNQLAWVMATDPKIEQRDLDLAEKIATRVNAAAKGQEANIVDTLARIVFMQGKKERAVELQEKAVGLADASQKKAFQKVLDTYKKGQLPEAN